LRGGGRTEMQRRSPFLLNRQDIAKEARTLFDKMERQDAAALARWYSSDPVAGSSQTGRWSTPGCPEIRFQKLDIISARLNMIDLSSVRGKLAPELD